MGDNKDKITFQELYDLVKDSNEPDFDPIEAAFHMVEKNGHVDLEKVGNFFGELNMEGVTPPIVREAARQILKEKRELNGESFTHDEKRGRITLEAFRKLCDLRPDKDEDDEREEEQRRLMAQAAKNAGGDGGGGGGGLFANPLGQITDQLGAATAGIQNISKQVQENTKAAIAGAKPTSL